MNHKVRLRITVPSTQADAVDPNSCESRTGGAADIEPEAVTDKHNFGARHGQRSDRFVKQFARGLHTRAVGGKDGGGEEIEHTGAGQFFEIEILPRPDVGDQAKAVGTGQPSQGSCVGIGHAPYFMLRHDTLEELQLGPRQGTRAGQGTQSIQDLWKGVAPLRIVVDRRERLVTCRDGLLHCWSGKTSSTERVVRACVVLVWPETILI